MAGLLAREEEQPGFVEKILFTDECNFTREGSFNLHNSHIWSDENPRVYTIRHYQYRFSVNLWAGILHDSIVIFFCILLLILKYITNTYMQIILLN